MSEVAPDPKQVTTDTTPATPAPVDASQGAPAPAAAPQAAPAAPTLDTAPVAAAPATAPVAAAAPTPAPTPDAAPAAAAPAPAAAPQVAPAGAQVPQPAPAADATPDADAQEAPQSPLAGLPLPAGLAQMVNPELLEKLEPMIGGLAQELLQQHGQSEGSSPVSDVLKSLLGGGGE